MNIIENILNYSSCGIYVEAGELLWVRLSSNKGKITLEECEALTFSSDNVKRLDIVHGDPLVVSAVGAQDVVLKHLHIQLTKKKDIDAVIEFEAEPLLPYPVEEALVSYQIKEQAEDGSRIVLMAVPKTAMEVHLDSLETRGIIPEVVSSTPNALAAFAHAVLPASAPALIIHMGKTETISTLVKEGQTLGFHTVRGGIEHINEAETTRKLCLEIGRTLLALMKQSKLKDVAYLMLVGEAGTNQELIDTIEEHLRATVTLPEPTWGKGTTTLQKYAIPIGLALSGLKKKRINFRKSTFAYPNPWKRTKKPLIGYLAGCGLLSFAILFLGYTAFNKNLSELKKEYISTLEEVGKPFESDTPIYEMSERELSLQIEELKKDLENAPRSYALYPNVPRVSDILVWLSNHPEATRKDGSPLIDIKNFQYTLVKRPDMRRKNEKYQVRIDLEFSAIPRDARKFHDALIEPNPFIDLKSEVKWNQSQDRYRTSFFLKNRTPRSSNV